MSNITFFFQGPFSSWHRCEFVVDDIKFSSTKQYLMYHKAAMFGDFEIANKILKEPDPKKQKALARTVHKFDMNRWNDESSSIMFRGNYYKFLQNKRLYDMLLNTYPAQIAEANPYDEWWGCGLDEKSAKATAVNKWPGMNVLGIVLTDLRDHLINEEKIEGK